MCEQIKTINTQHLCSGSARPGRARSNDLAERLPPWLSFFLSKEINVYRKEHIRNDTVSINLPTAKICNQSQVSIHLIFIIVSVTKIIIRLCTDVISMIAFKFSASVTFY